MIARCDARARCLSDKLLSERRTTYGVLRAPGAPTLTDIAHPDPTPRHTALMVALHLAHGDVPAAQLELLELIAWLSFDKPKHSEVRDPSVRVLVVDRSADAAHVGCVLFSHLGHTAMSSHTGQEALSMMDVFRPDVVVLDLDVRRVNGCDVARLLRLRRNGAYIVGVSSWCDDADRRRALAVGCDSFLAKPMDLAKIRGLLASISPR